MAWYNDLWSFASETVSSAGEAIRGIFTPETKEIISSTYGIAKNVVGTAKDIAEIKQALQPQKGFVDPPKVNLEAGSGRYQISAATRPQDIGFESPAMRQAVNNLFSTQNPSVVSQLNASLRNVPAAGPTIRLAKASDVKMPPVRKLRKGRGRYV